MKVLQALSDTMAFLARKTDDMGGTPDGLGLLRV